jgi:hypothetical protein
MRNQSQQDVTLMDILNAHKTEVVRSINCHAIGKIQKFDSSTQTCSVKISYSKTIFEKKSSGAYTKKTVDFPILLDCPTIFISGGPSGLTMPVSAGDDCLVMFNDRDIDNWISGANEGSVSTPRLHSLSDGIVLVGIRAERNKIPSFESSSPCLYNGTTKIIVEDGKIKIKNDANSLGPLLKELVDAIKAITTTNCVVGAPVAVSPASQVQLTIIATKLEGLLS